MDNNEIERLLYEFKNHLTLSGPDGCFLTTSDKDLLERIRLQLWFFAKENEK